MFPWESIFQQPREAYVPSDVIKMCIIHFGLEEDECTKDDITAKKLATEVSRLRWRISSAVLRSCDSYLMEVQNEELNISDGTVLVRGALICCFFIKSHFLMYLARHLCRRPEKSKTGTKLEEQGQGQKNKETNTSGTRTRTRKQTRPGGAACPPPAFPG